MSIKGSLIAFGYLPLSTWPEVRYLDSFCLIPSVRDLFASRLKGILGRTPKKINQLQAHSTMTYANAETNRSNGSPIGFDHVPRQRGKHNNIKQGRCAFSTRLIDKLSKSAVLLAGIVSVIVQLQF